MPFNCFAPSYHETLPRHAHSPLGSRPNLYFTDSTGPTSPTSRTRGKSVDSHPAAQAAGSAAASLTAKNSNRRSYDTRDKRVSKDLIGHPDPSSFVHVQRGSMEDPCRVAAPAPSGSLAALQKSMERVSLASHGLPSTNDRSLPLADQTNSPSPSPSAAQQISPALKAPRRKPAPPVTASVIRQAGPAAVAASSSAGGRSQEYLPSIVHQASLVHPFLSGGAMLNGLEERRPASAPAVVQLQADVSNLERSGAEGGVGSSGGGEAAAHLDGAREDGNEDYMTDTAKVRLDDGLRALQEALKG